LALLKVQLDPMQTINIHIWQVSNNISCFLLYLVNFDLGQIYNSQKFTESSDLFAVLPIAMVAGFSNGSAPQAPAASSQALCTIKSNFLNLIHQADVVVNGKSIEQCQPFINIARHFQLKSEMSVNDLATLVTLLDFLQL